MVTLSDGNQIGVQPNNMPDRRKQALLGTHPACFAVTSTNLCADFVAFHMVIGAIRIGLGSIPLNDCATVVAVRQSPNSAIKLIATISPFGSNDGEIESSDLPREVTFDELVANGILVGRFEGATWSDIQWYFNYCAYPNNNNNNWPPSDVSFPSTEGPGPDGRKGSIREDTAVIDQHD